MDLLEYQGKQLFAKHGIPVPDGEVAATVDEAFAAAERIGYPCAIKAQVLIGGRGKAGGIRIAADAEEARANAETILGTPDYIAPEQVKCAAVTPQTDIYNLGATLYWALTGKAIPTLYTVQKKGEHSFLLDSKIETPMELNPKVPPAVSNLVMECVSTKPAKRPADMDQMINRLELGKHILQKQAGQPIS